MRRKTSDGFAREEFGRNGHGWDEDYRRRARRSEAARDAEAEGRKERLRKEAQDLREMLRNKEKELLELGEQET